MFPTRGQLAAIAAVATLGVVLINSNLSAAAETYKWDMTETYPPTSISGLAAGDFARLVNEKSGGRITINVHYNGSLGLAEKDLLNLVEQNVVTVSSTITDKLLGTMPLVGIQFMPFMTGALPDAKAMSVAIKPYLDAELVKTNSIYLFTCYGLPVGIWSKKPVDSIEAIKTIKLRTNNPNSTKTFQNAGASPTFLAWSDVTPALTTGLIDAVLTSDESGVSVRFYDQLKYFTRLNYEIGLYMVHMNKSIFDKLPPDLKKAVLDAANEAGRLAYDRSINRMEENTKVMKANSVTIIDNVPPEFRKRLLDAGAFLLDDWKKRVGPETANKILTTFESERKTN